MICKNKFHITNDVMHLSWQPKNNQNILIKISHRYICLHFSQIGKKKYAKLYIFYNSNIRYVPIVYLRLI